MKWKCMVIVVAVALLLLACRLPMPPAPLPTSTPLPSPTMLPPTATPTPFPTRTPLPTWTPTPAPLSVRVDERVDVDALIPAAPFIVHFAQPMNPDSAPLPLHISPAAEGLYTWDDTHTILVFVPRDLQPGNRYTFALAPALAAQDGRTFETQPRWFVQTHTAPRVMLRRLLDGDKALPAFSEVTTRHPVIQLTFDQPMDQDSVAKSLQITPRIARTLSWQENVLVIKLDEALQPGAVYDFALDARAVARNGIPLSQAYDWSVKVKPLIAYYTVPVEHNREQPVTIHFNYTQNPGNVEKVLRLEPELAGTWSWDGDNTLLTFTPDEPLPPYTEFTLRFTGNFLDANGDSLHPPDLFHFTTPPPIVAFEPQGDGVSPVAPLRVTFDRPVDEAATTAAFQITPPLSGTFMWEETTLTFQPEAGYFEQHTLYTVTLTPLLKSSDGQELLSRPYTWTFQTREFAYVASFGDGPNAQVLDVEGRRAVQYVLTLREAGTLTFELYQLTLEQFLDRYASGFKGVAGYENRPISLVDTSLAKRWWVETEGTGDNYQLIQEVQIPDDVPPGLYVLNMRVGNINDQLILLLTRNTLMVKQSELQIVAWVTDIAGGTVQSNDGVTGSIASATGSHIPGIEVGVYARDGTLLAQGLSDANGVFRADLPPDVRERGGPQPLIVIVRNGEDITASGLSNEWRTDYTRWWGWWRPQPTAQDYAAYIYTDRPIYRPGQSVFFKVIVRRDDDALLSLMPAGSPVTARIRDARNNVVQTFVLATNDFGTVNGEFQLAEGAMLGDYAVEVALGEERHRQTFKVEDYRKPDYQVKVTAAEGTRYLEGGAIQVAVESSYFFGEPIPNAGVEVNLFMLGTRYWWWDDVQPDDEYLWFSSYRDPIKGRTDAQGRFTFEMKAELRDYTRNLYWGSNVQEATWGIEATVDDGSHQTVSGFTVLKVYNVAERVYLNPGGYLHAPGEAFIVQAEAHNILQDVPIAGRDVEVTLRRWDRTSHDYTQVLQTLPITTGDQGRTMFSLTVEEPGYYQLQATMQGAARDGGGKEITYKTYLYIFGERYVAWYGRDEALTLIADKESYAPGDTARLIVESQYAGPALLTFERATTRREQLIELITPTTLIDVPILPDDVPNIYVTVNIWQEQPQEFDPYSYNSIPDAQLHTASINLSVPTTDKQLTITLTPDKATYAPREEATFTARVTDYLSRPVVAELSLALVDEAIFALSEELAGPIAGAFYAERAHVVRTYDALALRRVLMMDGMGGGGGGDGIAANPRSDFPDTAAWIPALRTNVNGEAIITFTLPDTLTRWRLTAKATTAADTKVGETQVNVITHQPIVARPILPRVLTVGDQTTLSALIHNYAEESQTLAVSLAASPLLTFSSAAELTQTLTLPPGGQQIVGWPVSVAAAGEAQILVTVGVGDAVQEAVQLPLTIRPLAVPDVATQVGQFREALTTTVLLPPGALPMSTLHIELSRSIAGTVLEGLEYLTGFPYGCVEQTMSRALPNAVVGRALAQLGVSDPQLAADLPPKINASLQRLYGYQHNDGGWGWWYDDETHPYQTAWVVFGLATTREAGYEVDAGVIQRGVDWINQHFAEMDPRTRAYALYSIAVAGSPNLTETLALVQGQDDLDTFSRAGLALALHAAGEPDAAHNVIDVLTQTATIAEGLIYWTGDIEDGHYYQKTMASDTRNTALALSALVKVQPDHPFIPDIVRWLMSQRKQQGWGSTNETAHAIIALTDHLLATSFSEDATATTYTVLLNGDTITGSNLGAGEPAISLVLPAEYLQTGENTLTLVQSGEGLLYYVLNTRVYLAQAEILPAGKVQIERAYVDLKKTPIERAGPGQLVEVQITVTLPEDGTYLIVEDHLPGGLEALNERLNTTSHVVAGPYDDPYYYWRQYGYNHKEVYGDRVAFFITEMRKGTYTFTYYARATHTGDFVALPVEVSAMYDLATWGRSGSDRLSVSSAH
ncbi:MAG: Ig-like domain-containing protein [Anaerolineae bacterium]|nr:Ig-like domain-containing protein [Anaerolineae bacterium]